MGLDSDIHGADANLSVRFYENVKANPPAVYCRIDIPGDATQVWDQPATDAEKQRFPQHWLRYCMDTGSSQEIGTSLTDWAKAEPDVINDNQAMALHAMNFRSVEMVANASDAQLQRIGMGAVGLQQSARTFLRNRSHFGNSSELDQAKAELAELRGQMAEMMELMKANAPRAPGRPKKVSEDVLDHNAPASDAGHG